MTMTWGFGLRHDLSAADHRRVLHALWELSPKHREGGDCVRDVVVFGGAHLMYECIAGEYQRTPESISVPIFEAIERAGRFVSWSDDLAADFHEGVGQIFVPFPIVTPSGHVESLHVELPVLGRRLVQYTRVQSRWLAIDDESELLAVHGLSKRDVFEMNDRAHTLEDLAVEYELIMSYG